MSRITYYGLYCDADLDRYGNPVLECGTEILEPSARMVRAVAKNAGWRFVRVDGREYHVCEDHPNLKTEDLPNHIGVESGVSA